MVRRERLKGTPAISSFILAAVIMCCAFAPLITGRDPGMFYLESAGAPPCREFLFGTDMLGRDLFSGVFYGGRTSLITGVLGAALITVIGTFYGALSAVLPDRADSVMMRIAETGGSVPSILQVLIISSITGAETVIKMSLVLGITGWYGMARIVRSEVRQIRSSEYALYARCTGGSFFHVMRYHLVPNIIPAVMFASVSSFGTCIMTESTLSFLGLGLPVEVLSWGSMLSLANRALITGQWWVIVIPGLFMTVTLLCITSLGNFIRVENDGRQSNLR